MKKRSNHANCNKSQQSKSINSDSAANTFWDPPFEKSFLVVERYSTEGGGGLNSWSTSALKRQNFTTYLVILWSWTTYIYIQNEKSLFNLNISTWLVDRVLPEEAVASNQSLELQVSLVSCMNLWQLIIPLAWHQNLLSRYPDECIDNNKIFSVSSIDRIVHGRL